MSKSEQKGAFLILVVLSLSTLPVQAKYGGGNGTAEDPYLICTAEQMNSIGEDPNDWDKHFKLMADIDLSGFPGKKFSIIGAESNPPFTGVFDGNGHKISNFTYSCTKGLYIGIFGYVDGSNAEIKNLGLIDPNIDTGTGDWVGSLAGRLENGIISNCYVKSGSVSGEYRVGGLVGLSGGTITDCYATANVSGYQRVGGLAGDMGGIVYNCYAMGSISGDSFIGGLAGNHGSSGTISNCYATGSISGQTDYIGGLVGLNSGTISQSCATGDVLGGGSYVGGLAGAAGSYSTIIDCYATGSVVGGEKVGGLAGWNRSYDVHVSMISNCYSIGSVSGDSEIGGLVGGNNGTIEYSLWDKQTSGLNNMCGSQWGPGTGCDSSMGKTTAEMMTESTFTSAGWDFTTPIWTMCYYGGNYPRLWWQEPRVYYVDAADGNDQNIGLTPATAFATIEAGIDAALGCEIVSVQPGVYNEDVAFPGKGITVTSSDPTDPNIVNNTIIAGYVRFSGTEDSNCTFAGFRIDEVNFGVISGNGTRATIDNCIISGNSPCAGTAINNCDGIISNCLVTDNSAGGCGESYVINKCNGLIRNCTIANNASGVGALFGGSMTIENCIIYNNGGGSDSQIDIFGEGVLDISYSNIQDGVGGIGGDGTVNWGLGNIDVDPCFVDDANGDYHLKSYGWRWDSLVSCWTYDYVTSRCIDAGNPGTPLGNELMTVPCDPLNEYGMNLRVNMGFFGGTSQASMPPYGWALLSDLSNDGLVDYVDLAGQVENWLTNANEQPGDLNRDGIGNMKDFAALAEDWLQTTDWGE